MPLLRRALGIPTLRDLAQDARNGQIGDRLGFNSYWRAVNPPPQDPNAPQQPQRQPGILDRHGGLLGTGYFDALAAGAVEPYRAPAPAPQAPRPPVGPQPPPFRQDARYPTQVSPEERAAGLAPLYKEVYWGPSPDNPNIFWVFDAFTGERVFEGTQADALRTIRENGWKTVVPRPPSSQGTGLPRQSDANPRPLPPITDPCPSCGYVGTLTRDPSEPVFVTCSRCKRTWPRYDEEYRKGYYPEQHQPLVVAPPRPVEFRTPLPTPPPISMAQAEDFVRQQIERGHIMQGDPIEVVGIWDAQVFDRTDPRAVLPFNRGEAEVFARTAAYAGFHARVLSRSMKLPPNWEPRETFFVVIEPNLGASEPPRSPGSSIGEPPPPSDARSYAERMSYIFSNIRLMLDYIEVNQLDDAQNHLMRAKGVFDSFDNQERDELSRTYPATYQALGKLSHAVNIAEDDEWQKGMRKAIEHWGKGARIHEAPPPQAYPTRELYPQPPPQERPPPPQGAPPSDKPIIPESWQPPPPPADIPRAKPADVKTATGEVTFEKASNKAQAVFVGTTKVGEVIKVKGSMKDNIPSHYEFYAYPQAPPGLKLIHGQALGGFPGYKDIIAQAAKADTPDSRAAEAPGLQKLSVRMMAALRGYLECASLSEQQRMAELEAADAQLEAAIAQLRQLFQDLTSDEGYWLSAQMGPVYQLMRVPVSQWDYQSVMNAIVFLETLASQAAVAPGVPEEQKKTWAA